ncbi:hypothetical protein AB0F71_07080 [Kitasatospora sp. NPDC028055]|uniref:hypothetical protein n=1 Tax=Kitasatospora sp. NPDC028055 TaxID=3155653 RepID=UPI0033CDEDA2
MHDDGLTANPEQGPEQDPEQGPDEHTAGTAPSGPVLDLLAEHGRTRRIRTTATARLHRR